MGKKIFLFFFILMTAATIGIIALIGSITWDQYQDTKEWQNTEYGGKLKDTPPFLAKNYVDVKDQKAVRVWKKVAKIIDRSENENGIPKENWEPYKKTLKRSLKLQEAYGITSGEIDVQNKRLGLYLELEEAFASAYESPATETLKELSDRLYTVNLEYSMPADAVYFNRLRAVAGDYENLSVFLSDIFPLLGHVEDGVLIAGGDVDEDTTANVQAKITELGLTKFPFVESLYQALGANDWSVVLMRNETGRQYHAWEKARSTLESIQKTDYWSPTEVTTYQQALDRGLTVIVNERDGYTVDPQSPVNAITKDGIPVVEGQYIKHGTPVEVTILENYIEIPKEEDEAENGGGNGKPGEEKPDKEKPGKKPDKEDDGEDAGDTPKDEPEEEPEDTDEGDGWEDWEDNGTDIPGTPEDNVPGTETSESDEGW